MGVETKSGQFSIEFIIVWGVLLTVLAFVTMPLYNSSRADARKASELSQAREAANKIAGALNTVYSGGVGARQTVEYWLPESVDNVCVDDSNQNGRINVIVEFETWENKVIVGTLLDNALLDNVIVPSQSSEKVVRIKSGENMIRMEPENMTLHRTTFTYCWNSGRQIEVEDNIIERKFVGSKSFG